MLTNTIAAANGRHGWIVHRVQQPAAEDAEQHRAVPHQDDEVGVLEGDAIEGPQALRGNDPDQGCEVDQSDHDEKNQDCDVSHRRSLARYAAGTRTASGETDGTARR